MELSQQLRIILQFMKEESGKTFAERMKEQALSAGVEIRYENVTETKAHR